MLLKFFVLLAILYKNIYCIEIDGIIIGDKKEFYYFAHYSSKKLFTYEIQRDLNKKYFEIFYFYSKLKILKENEIIYQTSEGEESGENSFTFEHDGSKYYMNIEYLSYSEYGFILKSQNSPYNYILNSSVTFDLIRKRSINYKIVNNKNQKSIICIRIPTTFRIDIKQNSETQIEENGNKINCKYLRQRKSDGYYTYYFYAVLSDNISFFSNFYTTWYVTLNGISSASIYLDNYKIYEITEDQTISLNDGSFEFYIIKNNMSQFEISFLQNTELYMIESNVEYIKIKDIQRYNKNSNLFMMDSQKSKGLFHIMFMNEKNSIKNDKTFSLYICDTREYKMTIINDKTKYIQFGFMYNSYINLTKIYISQEDKEIYASYKNSDDYYIFEFEKDSNSNETEITLKFEKKKDLSEFKEVRLFYKAINYDVGTIENDYFECVNSSKKFLIRSNTEKKYINITFNSTANIFLNDSGINGWTKINVTDNKIYYLNIYANKEEPICFNALFTKSGHIEIKKDEKRTFKLFLNYFDYQYFELFFIELKKDKKYNLNIDYGKNFTSSSLTFKKAEIIKNENYEDKEIEFIPEDTKVGLNFRIYKDKRETRISELTIHFYMEKTEEYKVLVQFSRSMAYVCFAITLIIGIYFFYKFSLGEDILDKDLKLKLLALIFFCPC